MHESYYRQFCSGNETSIISLQLVRATGSRRSTPPARRALWTVASELWGQGGTLDPQVQDFYPLYLQVKDVAYVKILSKRLLTTRLYKVRTNLYPPLTKTFRRAWLWSKPAGHRCCCRLMRQTDGRSSLLRDPAPHTLRAVSITINKSALAQCVTGNRFLWMREFTLQARKQLTLAAFLLVFDRRWKK